MTVWVRILQLSDTYSHKMGYSSDVSRGRGEGTKSYKIDPASSRERGRCPNDDSTHSLGNCYMPFVSQKDLISNVQNMLIL